MSATTVLSPPRYKKTKKKKSRKVKNSPHVLGALFIENIRLNYKLQLYKIERLHIFKICCNATKAKTSKGKDFVFLNFTVSRID